MPLGSLRHFAVLYSASRAKESLAAIYAFERQIRDTVCRASHEAAHARLQWWRGEIDRLVAGNPVHPVTRALQALPDAADRTLLHETIVAADIDLARMTLTSSKELEAYCQRACGALQTLAAHACAGSRPLSGQEQRFARELGACVRQVELIRDLPFDLTQGRLRVPLGPARICGNRAVHTASRYGDDDAWRTATRLARRGARPNGRPARLALCYRTQSATAWARACGVAHQASRTSSTRRRNDGCRRRGAGRAAAMDRVAHGRALPLSAGCAPLPEQNHANERNSTNAESRQMSAIHRLCKCAQSIGAESPQLSALTDWSFEKCPP